MMKYIFLLSLIFLFACDDRRMFEENRNFPGEKWEAGNPAVFKVHITDTVSAHRFFVNFRNSGQYGYSNLFLFLTTIYPDNSASVDTIELLLADPTGKWIGKGSGGIYENKVLFRENVVFPDTGVYTFTFVHGMRDESLDNVLDAGLRIEKQ